MLALVERRLSARRLHALIVGMPLDAASWAAGKPTPEPEPPAKPKQRLDLGQLAAFVGRHAEGVNINAGRP